MNDKEIEQEIQAKGLTAQRVSFSDLQANIAHTEIVKHVSPSGQVLRWAVLTTNNGFAVTGRPSASASSANDNAEIGEKIAIENATQELWPLMGYELKQNLFERSKIQPTEDAFQHFLSYSGSSELPEETQLKMWHAFQAAYPA